MSLGRYFVAAAVICFALPICGQAPAAAREGKLLVRHAVLLTMAPGEREPIRGYLLVGFDGRIEELGAGEAPVGVHARETLDAGGKYVLPAFISAHSHLWQSAFRGLAADKTLTEWITAIYVDHAAKATAEDFYWFTLDGALDHLQHGVTAAYSFNYGGDDSLAAGRAAGDSFNGEAFRAESDSGIRFVHGIDPGRVPGPESTTVAFGVAQARVPLKTFLDFTVAHPADGRLLSVMLNGATAFNTTYQQAVLEKALMNEFHVGNQSHYLEAPDTQYEDVSKFRWFLDSGLISRQLIFGHFIHTNPYILAQTSKAGASMSWNPLSNGRLASGVPDIPAYLKAGVRVGMGVDGEASADLADPFENMRAGLYAVRDKYEDATVMSPYDVLRLHTLGSADVLGVADRLGSLEVGKYADFLLVDPHRFRTVTDVYASLVFVAGERDITRVYMGGELRVLNGEVLGQDSARISAEVRERVERISTR